MRKGPIPCGQKFGRLSVGPRGPDTPKGLAKWICRCKCGKYTSVTTGNLVSGRVQSCGCLGMEKRRAKCGPLSPGWRGGRQRAGGYIRVRDRQHANANGQGMVLEHIQIMSKTLGRPLTKKETVHHKNGVRGDNRPENLELWASNHCSGQRVSDLVAHAKDILSTYEPKALAANVAYTPVFGRPPIYAQVK